MQQRRTKPHRAAHPNPPQVTAIAESVSPDPPPSATQLLRHAHHHPHLHNTPVTPGRLKETQPQPGQLTSVPPQGWDLPPAATQTHIPPAQATSAKPEGNPEAAGSLLSGHTQLDAVSGMGKLRHIRLASSHRAVCSDAKRNTCPSTLDPNNMQNIKQALYPDLGMLPIKT